MKTGFFEYLDFALQFAPAGPEEKEIRAKLARIGIGAGKTFRLQGPRRRAQGRSLLGMKEGEKKVEAAIASIGKDINGWQVGGLAVGDRDYYHGDWLLRAAAAKAGIYGNDAVEAMYPMTARTAPDEPLDGSKHNYTLTFPAGQLPPVNAFWSVTMYDGKTQLLIENPINRYLINSPMLPSMKKNADGSLTIYIQKDSPGKDKERQLAARSRTVRSIWSCASTGRRRKRLVNPAARRRHLESAGHRAGEVNRRRDRASTSPRPKESVYAKFSSASIRSNSAVADLPAYGLRQQAAGRRGDARGRPAGVRAIAKEAYIYGFPMVTNYETMYKQAIDTSNKDYRAPFNTIANSVNIATPDDKFVVTPNFDTPYSFLWMDLRAEPIIVTMPKIEKNRYYTGQLVDLYTYNFAYLGTRSYGNDGGTFMIAGPGWKGETPKGVNAVMQSETQFAYILFRTQLFNPADLSNVKKIQAGYHAQALSQYLKQPSPAAAPAVNWPAPPRLLLAGFLLIRIFFVRLILSIHISRHSTPIQWFATSTRTVR